MGIKAIAKLDKCAEKLAWKIKNPELSKNYMQTADKDG